MENISNLLPPRPVIYEEDDRHVSCFNRKVKYDHIKSRSAHATMGFAETPLRPPDAFLRSKQRDNIEKYVADKNRYKSIGYHHEYCDPKDQVPRPINRPTSWKPASDNTTLKKNNWINYNVVQMKKSSTRIPTPKFIDNQHGNINDLLSSGKWPNYIFKKNFGKIPNYLKHQTKEINAKEIIENENKKEEFRRVRIEEQNQDHPLTKEEYKQLPPDEKTQLLEGLTKNLKEKQRKLQILPVMCETLASIKKRDNLEEEITSLNTYIFLLNNYIVSIGKYY